MTHTFVIPKTSTFGTIFMVGMIAALAAGTGWFLELRSESLPATVIGVSVMLPLALMVTWFLYLQGRSKLSLTPDELILDVPWYSKTIKRSDLLIGEARVIGPEDKEWSLKWRTNGIGLPGYAVGWFSTKGGSKVLAAQTSGRRVLIPTSANFTLLVSLDNPESFLKALATNAH